MKLCVILTLALILSILFSCNSNSVKIEIPDGEPYYKIKIEDPRYDPGFTFVGMEKDISVYLDSIGERPLGEFNLSIAFNDSALSVMDIVPGEAIECWDVFSYHVDTTSILIDDSTFGIIRITAIADVPHISNQSNCPEINNSILVPNTELIKITFYVKDHYQYECQYVPIIFYWNDCKDNTVSTGLNQERLISQNVYEMNWISDDDLYNKLIPDDSK